MATSLFLRLSKCALTFHGLRNVLALGLAALLFFAPQVFTVSAQQPASAPTKVADDDYFVTYRDVKGDTVCRGATAVEKRQLRAVRTENLGLRPLYRKPQYEFQAHAQAADAEPQKIILRATAQLENFPEAKAAFIKAAQLWEQKIKSPIQIYIDVDFGTTFFGNAWNSPNVLGSTSSPRWQIYYPSLRDSLIARASTPQEASLYNSLPLGALPTNKTNADILWSTGPLLRALALLNPIAGETEPAPRIGFNSNYQFDFDPSDGIDYDKADFEAVAMHEIGHALGFNSTAGSVDVDYPPSIWDIFRFREGTSLETFGTAQRIMTPDGMQYYFSGGRDLSLSTGGPNGQAPGGDGNQSSHWKESSQNYGRYIGIMDARLPLGARRQMTYNDISALNFFGYDMDTSGAPPPPPANDNFANAIVLEGCGGSVDGTTLSATRELNEPYHGAGSEASAWYEWHAATTGEVTFNTAGDRTNYNSALAIYTGDSLGSLQQLYRDDGYLNYSEITLYVNAGTTYKIAVDGYSSAEGDFVLNWKRPGCVGKSSQSISFSPLTNKTYGDAPFTVSANASSGLPVSLSVVSGPATVSGDTVTINGTGSVIIRASQAGNTDYNAAPNVQQSFIVNKASATITLGNLTQTYDGEIKNATATTAPAGLSGVTLSYSLNGTPMTMPTNAGNYGVEAVLDNGNYQAIDATGTLVIAKANQTINFAPLANKNYGDAAINLTANTSSGLPVNFKVISGPATISGNTLTMTGIGTVVVRASQAGSANYNVAANVDRSFVVNKAQATLTLGSLNHVYNGLAKKATVVTNPAGLSVVAISYSQNGTPVAAPTYAGSYAVKASLSNSKYQATIASATLVIAKANQTISFAPLATKAYGSGAFNVAATATSRLPVRFTIVSGPARISGNTITPIGVGTVVVRASQAGNGNYNVAAPVDRPFTVTKAAQTITFDALPSKTYGNAPFALSATSSAGLPVSFQVVSGPATLYGNKLTLSGVGRVTVRAIQAGNGNYNAAPAVVRAFDVTSANPNIALSGLVFTYDGTVKSATVVTKPAGLNVTVSYSQNGASVTPLKAGSYSVSATINDANYKGTATGTLVINKAQPVITWGNPAAIVTGTALSGAQLNAKANVPGTFKYTPAAGIVLGAGSYHLTTTFTPTDVANYTTATKSVVLTVNRTTAQALIYDMAIHSADVARNAMEQKPIEVRFSTEPNIFPRFLFFTACCQSG